MKRKPRADLILEIVNSNKGAKQPEALVQSMAEESHTTKL
jgi:hypothetical protein